MASRRTRVPSAFGSPDAALLSGPCGGLPGQAARRYAVSPYQELKPTPGRWGGEGVTRSRPGAAPTPSAFGVCHARDVLRWPMPEDEYVDN